MTGLLVRHEVTPQALPWVSRLLLDTSRFGKPEGLAHPLPVQSGTGLKPPLRCWEGIEKVQASGGLHHRHRLC